MNPVSVRVVFLDFDGVLRGGGDWFRNAGSYLETLTQRAHADVVVSSDWRRGRPRTVLCDLLRAQGYTGRVLGTTPDLQIIQPKTRVPRGAEIAMWLAEQRYRWTVEAFVILDDCDDMAPCVDRLVQCDPSVGLTMEDVVKAWEIFERQV
jgi:hypothetical protein